MTLDPLGTAAHDGTVQAASLLTQKMPDQKFEGAGQKAQVC
jgi:hypothetical protein